MSQRYRKAPSEILAIDDPYTAYCLDEACAIIANKIDQKEEPAFVTHYKSYSELCRAIL